MRNKETLEEPTEEAKQRAENYMSLKGALEPLQETLEDFIRRESKSGNESVGIVKGVIWQAERMYSEEEVKKLIVDFLFTKRIGREVGSVKEWFEQQKKK
jgi:hypothetical protein